MIDPALIEGRGYRLEDTARVERSYARFLLNSDYGTSDVIGTVSLLERINEFAAIGTLEAMKRSEVYKDALKRGAKAPVEYGKELVDEPVETLKNTARGFGSFLADVGYSLVSDDPSQENAAKTALGFDAAKRQFAFQLGVNPYSRFEPLQEQLSEVAWTAVGGGLTVSAAFRAVKDTPGTVLKVTKTANGARSLVRDNSPRKLETRNVEALQAMGISEALAETFTGNFNYDPEAETRLVTALESMQDVAGRADVVSRAALVTTPQQANTLRDWVELLAAYHDVVTPAVRLAVVSSALFIVDADNSVHGVFPTDYVGYTDDVESRIEATTRAVRQAGYQPGPLYATGQVEEPVCELFLALGWQRCVADAGRLLRTES
jgi:hypothetical protein